MQKQQNTDRLGIVHDTSKICKPSFPIDTYAEVKEMNAVASGSSIWHTFLLVSFGGIFGTILTLTVTWWRERSKKAEEQKGKLQWLLAEIIDNLEHVQRYSLAGGRAKVKLLTQAWETVKGDTLDLNPDLTKALRTAYAEVWRFNSILEYDIRIPPGHGLLNEPLQVKAGEVEAALSDSQSKLTGHLGV
jgi:hypothetical protein